MGAVKKALLLFLTFFLLGTTSCLLCYATETVSIQVIEEIEIPQEINFAVSNMCAGHAYFMQAAANRLGNFAIYTRHVHPEDNFDVNFNKVYIDIYQHDGNFMYEVSFTTPLDLAMELEEESVNIYFYDYMIEYDFVTQEVSCYSIPEGVAINGGLYKQLRSETFLAGDWTYSCKKSFDGYTKLTRSDDAQVQVLVEMPGTGGFWRSSILIGGGVGIICIIIIVWQLKRKRQ